MAHFTCVGATVEDLRAALDQMRDAGIDNVLTLRGDPPRGETEFVPTEGGLATRPSSRSSRPAATTSALSAPATRRCTRRRPTATTDLAHLQEKVDAGVKVLITQLFFDNARVLPLRRGRARRRHRRPDRPGHHADHERRADKALHRRCAARRYPCRCRRARPRRDDPAAVVDLGVAYATLQCAELLARGAPGIHFYTLNRSPATRAILSALRLQRPWERRAGGEPALGAPL